MAPQISATSNVAAVAGSTLGGVSSIAIASAFAARAIEKWEVELGTPEVWSGVDAATEIWQDAANATESWSAVSPDNSEWTPAPATSEIWADAA